MKRKMILLGLAFISGVSYVQAQNVNPTCFQSYSDFNVSDDRIVKVKIPKSADNVFFLEGNDLVPYKFFGESKSENYSYRVISVSSGNSSDFKFLNDGNPTSFYSFDNLKDDSKSIIIYFTDGLKSGSFSTQFQIQHDGGINYYISDDNANYKQVNERAIDEFSFKYLKMEFVNRMNDTTVKNTRIGELSFIKPTDKTLLMKPLRAGKIDVYANYECPIETLSETYGKYIINNSKVNYPVDSETKLITLPLSTNPSYNDDIDKDGVKNGIDDCTYKYNPDQKDSDGDLVGDACDSDNLVKNPLDGDIDKDGVTDSVDDCRYVYNPDQRDSNGDGLGDACMDDDSDGLLGRFDNCPDISNSDQKDVNVNGIGDDCEFDKDKDGIPDGADNCMTIQNKDQKDGDGDGIGDSCDNCKYFNPDQLDKNGNGKGDVCEEKEQFEKTHDKDSDGVVDFTDNCKNISNPGQEDLDKDEIGDSCDNCVSIQNKDQEDEDNNSVGDMCEDTDKDEIEGYKDNCPTVSNQDQKDSDNDGVGNVCEDKDSDGIIAAKDNCPFEYNKDQSDVDNDGKGDLCDNKDDRFLESNRWLFIGLLILISGAFGTGIFMMTKKMR